jgi:uncharacterized protein (TIGR02246 family)
MKPIFYLIALISTLGIMNSTTWAGPVEEIAQIAQQQAAAGEKNDLDAFTAPFADDAVVTAYWIPFRVEGKAAIKEQFALLFQTYPTRKLISRQIYRRVYANDTVVVNNGYGVNSFTDKAGNISVHYVRVSQTWVKIGAEWKIVDQHVSRMPIP